MNNKNNQTLINFLVIKVTYHFRKNNNFSNNVPE